MTNAIVRGGNGSGQGIGLNGRTVLVVGGAGYVGSVVMGHLLERGYRIRCVDNLLYNHQSVVIPFLSHPNLTFKYGDLVDQDDMIDALDGVTDVLLLAGLVGDPITAKYPEASAAINDEGYDRMLRLLQERSLENVIFVSTCSNYGLRADNEPADETSELKPLSLYAKSKVRVEKALLGLKRDVDFTPTVLRFATAFGLSPRMRFDLTVSQFTRDMFLGDELTVYDAETWRPYCHVRDFAEVIARVFEAPKEKVAFQVFNAGGDVNNFTKKMIVDTIRERIPACRLAFQEKGLDPRNYRVSFAKIKDTLDFEPSFTVADGVDELIGALRSGLFRNIEQPPSFFGNYEIEYPRPQ